jgi:hypothetical protein
VSRFVSIVAGALLLVAVTAQAQWPPPEIPPARDNTLHEDSSGKLSNGAGQHFFAGRTNQAEGSIRRAVVYFDIYSVWPPSVFEMFYYPQLRLHVSKDAGIPSQVSLHRLLSDWGEGTSDAPDDEGAGALSTVGDATWLHTFYDAQYWGTPGGDFVPAPSATLMISDTGFYTFDHTPQMEADLQYWYCHPDSNFGWILIGDELTAGTAKRFDSREHPDSALWPVLSYGIYTCDCFCFTEQGDMDEDGYWTALDLGIMIDALFSNGPNPICCEGFLADVNCDEYTDPLDLAVLIDVLFAGGRIDCYWYYFFDECGEVCGITPKAGGQRTEVGR